MFFTPRAFKTTQRKPRSLAARLTGSAAAAVALAGCVAVDEPAQHAPPMSMDTAPRTPMPQRPPEVRLASNEQDKQVEPMIKKGTGRFVDQSAQLNSPGRGNYVVRLDKVEVAEAVQQVLGDTLGLSYVIEGDVSGPVTIQTARPVDQRTLLQMLAGALATRNAALLNEGGFYRIAPIEAVDTASRIVGYGSSVSDLKVGPGVQVVQLHYISATEMEKILKPVAGNDAIARVDTARNIIILKDDSRNIASMLELVDLFDVDYMAGMSFALLPAKNTSAATLVTELDQLFGANGDVAPMAGLVRFVPIERLNAVLAISPQPQQLDQVRIWMDRLDRSGSSSNQSFHVIALQNRSAREVADLLSKTLSDDASSNSATAPSAVRPGLTPMVTETSQQETGSSQPLNVAAMSPAAKAVRIQADESNNSLIILSTPEEFGLLQQVVTLLDVSPNQVMLEATIAEVSLKDDLAYGLNWFLESGEFNFTFSDATNGAVASSFPGFSALFSGTDGRAVLNAVASVTDVKVLSSPSLMVLDNRTATLQVGDQVPIVTQTSVSTLDPNAPIVNQVEMRDTGVILKVTPRVNDGGRVTLEIEQEVSDVVQTLTSGIDSPTIQQRKIQTSVAVDNGSTIALGGLIRDRVTDGQNKVPLLGDIPGLGQLFRSTSKRNERTELIVLITPHVISSAEDSALVTSDLRERMRGVGQAIDAANRRSLGTP